MITPLQDLLKRKTKTISEVMAATGRSRWTVRRWRERETYPDPKKDVPKLLELFKDYGLKFSGCFSLSIKTETDEIKSQGSELS
ncbi:MAG: hypothetical protein RPU59_13935 [Candidatus Sedimenticola sp. (ex Thyasira tokunagai)]